MTLSGMRSRKNCVQLIVLAIFAGMLPVASRATPAPGWNSAFNIRPSTIHKPVAV